MEHHTDKGNKYKAQQKSMAERSSAPPNVSGKAAIISSP